MIHPSTPCLELLRCLQYIYIPTRYATLYQLDVSGNVFLTTYHSLHIQYLQKTPEHGPLRSETCRADTWVLINNQCNYIVYLVGMYIYSLPVFEHTFYICELITHRWHYISLTAVSIWRGFCMSGRKLLDLTTYTSTPRLGIRGLFWDELYFYSTFTQIISWICKSFATLLRYIVTMWSVTQTERDVRQNPELRLF